MGEIRIRKNIAFLPVKAGKNINEWAREIITNNAAKITTRGKNYYIELDNIILTVNRNTFTIITAHKIPGFF